MMKFNLLQNHCGRIKQCPKHHIDAFIVSTAHSCLLLFLPRSTKHGRNSWDADSNQKKPDYRTQMLHYYRRLSNQCVYSASLRFKIRGISQCLEHQPGYMPASWGSHVRFMLPLRCYSFVLYWLVSCTRVRNPPAPHNPPVVVLIVVVLLVCLARACSAGLYGSTAHWRVRWGGGLSITSEIAGSNPATTTRKLSTRVWNCKDINITWYALLTMYMWARQFPSSY